MDKEPAKGRPEVARRMQDWPNEMAFEYSGLRGPSPRAVAKPSEAEREDWQKLWADVAETLRRAEDTPSPKNDDKKP